MCRPSVCLGAEPCTLKTRNVQEPVPLRDDMGENVKNVLVVGARVLAKGKVPGPGKAELCTMGTMEEEEEQTFGLPGCGTLHF